MVRTTGAAASPGADMPIPVENPTSVGDLSFPSSQRSVGAAVKRFTPTASPAAPAAPPHSRPSDRRSRARSHGSRWVPRKGSLSATEVCFYLGTFGIVTLLAASFLIPQGLTVPQVVRFRERSGERDGRGRLAKAVRFMPLDLLRRFNERHGLDSVRGERRLGVRAPRLALVVGPIRKDPSSLMLSTIVRSLAELGYSLSVFAVDGTETHSFWKKMGFQVLRLSSNDSVVVDWSFFDGIILSSLETKPIASSLAQEPFHSVPLIWIIQEDTLANRLSVYNESGWQHLTSEWRSAFSRAEVVVFPDFSLPMLHSVLDSGNFFVISGSPADAWAAKIYSKTHSKHQLRIENGFDKDDLVILVIGSPFFYDELPLEYIAAVHVSGSKLTKISKVKGLVNSLKFVFLCGNSSAGHDSVFQEIESNLGFSPNSVRHYGFDSDMNGVLLMADIVLYASFQDEQGFPSLLLRAMSFGIPIIAPDLPIIKKFVVDPVNGLIYRSRDVDTLTRAFSLLVSEMELSELAHSIAASAKSFSENMFALDCIREYAELLENVIEFPSDVILPRHVSEIQKRAWEWNLFEEDIENAGEDVKSLSVHHDNELMETSSIVFSIEEEFIMNNIGNSTQNDTQVLDEEYPTASDWQVIDDIEISEELENGELEEVEERMEKTSGSWEYVYNIARKSEKKKFEVNERDEGELERIGRSLCIYEIYSGAGAWPFLHHGAIYRGISLTKGAKRSRSDDVDAVDRLPLLNNHYYKDLLCELGGMFSVANKVDNIHKIPWIGFQSWRAVGRKVSLSVQAAKVLEETIVRETRGDAIYFWAKLRSGATYESENGDLDFWTMCDIINNGKCRTVFEEAFHRMYGLSNESAALPPMPKDGDEWSILHNWVMPTPSFLQFIMFSRMFADSLHNVSLSSSDRDTCLLGFSNIEKKHCYCRVLELLVNVWAYHSARKIIYINPVTGELLEQHPIDKRRGLMWSKYFNFTLLKSMDEDLAEEADDGLRPRDGWLWPLTGEVHWQGILDREREERYRRKMDKIRKNKEKLLERQKHGYRQKALGG